MSPFLIRSLSRALGTAGGGGVSGRAARQRVSPRGLHPAVSGVTLTLDIGPSDRIDGAEIGKHYAQGFTSCFVVSPDVGK